MKTPAWQRSEGKNPKGGLNAKGRASAKAEGMNLKAPVKSGDNPRRASFLARMGNMPGPEMKDGKPTRVGPDHLSNVDFTKPIADGPITRGFDYYFGIPYSNDMWPYHPEVEDQPMEQRLKLEFLFRSATDEGEQARAEVRGKLDRLRDWAEGEGLHPKFTTTERFLLERFAPDAPGVHVRRGAAAQ